MSQLLLAKALSGSQLPEPELQRLLRYMRTEKIDGDKFLRMRQETIHVQARQGLLEFAKAVYPDFIMGRHHRILAEHLERVARGELRRLIISLPPRHTKSLLASQLFPAWYIGTFPKKKIIIASNTEKLAVSFGGWVRNLIATSPEYKSIFPDINISKYAKASGLWSTSQGGEFFAVGVGGTVTGRGGDVFLIDDPHSEQDALVPDGAAYDKAWDWYLAGPRQRLQPSAGIILICTRWHKKDLVGRILDRPGKIPWTYIALPMLDEREEPLWPEFWPQSECVALRADLPLERWECNYQQNPISDALSVIKFSDWNLWPPPDWKHGFQPPACDFIVQGWDTSYAANRRSNFSACTTWGTFRRKDERGIERDCIILLDAYQEQLEFPQLKEMCRKGMQFWKPDVVLIESKTAGYPLVQELRQSGIPVEDFCPVRGDRKEVRVNAIADLFASGMVWRPETDWSDAVAKQFAEFPHGTFDDFVDASTMCLMRLRRGGLVRQREEQDQDMREDLENRFAEVEYY